LLSPISAFAQHGHSDVEVGYDSVDSPTKFVFESHERTSDGRLFFEGNFGPPFYTTGDPGFETHDDPMSAGDLVFLNFLDSSDPSLSSIGKGYVTYFDPNTGELSAAGRIGVISSPGGPAIANLLMDGASLSSGTGPTRQYLGLVEGDGSLHAHVTFDLLDDATAPIGAYGVMFEMQSLFNGNTSGLADLTSEPIWFIFNHGMDDELFDSQALAAFGVASAIPEPGSAGVLLLTGLATLLRRRKR
jgi:hypothetical protein